jgi:hypothetical protein
MAPHGKLMWTFFLLLFICGALVVVLLALPDGVMPKITVKHGVILVSAVFAIGIIMALQFVASGEFFFDRMGLELSVITLGAAMSSFALWSISSSEAAGCPPADIHCKQSFVEAQAELPGLYDVKWMQPDGLHKIYNAERVTHLQSFFRKVEASIFGGTLMFSLLGTVLGAISAHGIKTQQIQKPTFYNVVTVSWGVIAFLAYLILLMMGV